MPSCKLRLRDVLAIFDVEVVWLFKFVSMSRCSIHTTSILDIFFYSRFVFYFIFTSIVFAYFFIFNASQLNICVYMQLRFADTRLVHNKFLHQRAFYFYLELHVYFHSLYNVLFIVVLFQKLAKFSDVIWKFAAQYIRLPMRYGKLFPTEGSFRIHSKSDFDLLT